jgi:hypothetical protein
MKTSKIPIGVIFCKSVVQINVVQNKNGRYNGSNASNQPIIILCLFDRLLVTFIIRCSGVFMRRQQQNFHFHRRVIFCSPEQFLVLQCLFRARLSINWYSEVINIHFCRYAIQEGPKCSGWPATACDTYVLPGLCWGRQFTGPKRKCCK